MNQNMDNVLNEQSTWLDHAIKHSINEHMKSVHTCLPAMVTAWDAENQRATIQLLIQQIKIDKNTGEDITINLSPIQQVPVWVFRAGNFAITLPVSVGDQGLAIFSERELTQWQIAGDKGTVKPLQIRTHDLTDAVFLPGFNPNNKKIASYDANNLVLRTLDNLVKISLESDKIVFTVGATTSTFDATGWHTVGGDVLADTISLKTHEHISANSGSPTSPPIP